jgi:hypothetical protein
MVAKVSKMANEAPPTAAAAAPQVSSTDALLGMMRESWNVEPRTYVLAAINSGGLMPSAAARARNFR